MRVKASPVKEIIEVAAVQYADCGVIAGQDSGVEPAALSRMWITGAHADVVAGSTDASTNLFGIQADREAEDRASGI
jgi:hypothetical protein